VEELCLVYSICKYGLYLNVSVLFRLSCLWKRRWRRDIEVRGDDKMTRCCVAVCEEEWRKDAAVVTDGAEAKGGEV
jgi:hypothetical protein